ncbi:pyridoxal phosphate-dependent aminotransferase [Marinicella meishanensis]|uniref:pyridoxal phosphate-dependent aminotransferase n=1 Tax=Marinicella meishanensis TaxID=2873263 RepID=UPI001CBB519E|nr:pyridoxal phosphate-dependent aminotransferase [Marinicella sp. NBU2979]
MDFKPFKMAQYSARLSARLGLPLQNLHSSNPQPWTWDELSTLTNTDLAAWLTQAPLHYEAVQGHPQLRAMLCQHLYPSLSANDVVLTAGAQEGIFLVMQALLKPGDEVITFSPGFEPLAQVAADAGAQVKILPLVADQGWHIDWPALEQALSDAPRLLVINFPHNPTGAQLSEGDLRRLVNLCEQRGCWLLADEVFRGLEHAGTARLSNAAELYDRAISMGVVSKALALPGVRLGWLAAQSQSLRDQLLVVKSHVSICQSSLDAHLCQAIVPHMATLWRRKVAIIEQNKALLNQRLQEHPKFHWQAPQAAATAFIQYRGDDLERLLQKWAADWGWLVLPNAVFLTDEAGFRLTLGAPDMGPIYQQMFTP